MNVELLTCTPNALNVLLFTKNTRLSMSGIGLSEVALWSEEKKAEELRYMRNTIQSSWEFVEYEFAITGVTRAFTHQLVRHRVGTSFAQQAQRVVNMEGFSYLATGELLACGAASAERSTLDTSPVENRANPANVYDAAMRYLDEVYRTLIAMGVKPQDARGVLPTNILTNIVFKANLRTLHEMALKRLCVKAQGEFQDVFRLLVDRVVETHPWAADFLRVQCAWNSTCLFPSLPVDQCHVKERVFNPETGYSYGGHLPSTPDEIYRLHRARRTEIQPTVTAIPEPPDEFTAADAQEPWT